MAIKNNISVDEMSQEIDLNELLGRAPTQNEIAAFQEEAIEQMIKRTQSNQRVDNGKPFDDYSESYAEKKGVSVSDVDLTLMGDMLLSVDARNSGGVIELFIDDKLNTKKGFNHHTGDTLPKRPWFGINAKEAKDIASSVKEESRTSISDAVSAAAIFQSSRELNIDEILRNIGFSID
jgi:hypothetical protein